MTATVDTPTASAHEMMVVTAARALPPGAICFVGIGIPSAACNLARLTTNPDITLIYESGTIGTKPDVLPLSIGDGELSATAVTTVSVPEMFRYWLQGGRVDVGFLAAAQIDRHANINTTVIGDYARPTTRLPGAGGAPEIASHCREVLVVVHQSLRTFVERVDFVTSFGFGSGGSDRADTGLTTAGITRVITDLGVLEPGDDGELVVTALHPGVDRDTIRAATGWDLRFAELVTTTEPPSSDELTALRDLQERTDRAHAGDHPSGNLRQAGEA